MKVLLLNPLYQHPVGKRHERYFIRSGSRWPHSGVKLKGWPAHYLPFPFSLAYAAAYLQKAAIDVWAIDAVALNLAQDLLLRQITALKPDLVFYELTTLTVDDDLFLAAKIKEACGARIALAGPHATYFASQIMQDHPAVDFIIRGEYEYILADLAQKLASGSDGFWGVVHRVNGSVTDSAWPQNQAIPDELPVPFTDIFPANHQPDLTVYWDGFCQRRPALQVQSSRGCRYACSFCLEASTRQYRMAPLQAAGVEIQKAVQKYGIREVYFDDDNFTQDMEHVERIFKAWQEIGLRVNWSAMTSFANLTPQVIRRLAAYGCIGLKLGLESASSHILEGMHKPLNLKEVDGIIAECKKCGIKTHLTLIIGFLNETEPEIAESFALSRRLDCDSIQVSIATPFPGTEFFKQAKLAGLLADAAWGDYDAKKNSVLHSSIAGKSLGKIRREFLSGWFLHKIFSLPWLIGHLPVIWRTLTGVGPFFFFKQLAAIYTDESKNR